MLDVKGSEEFCASRCAHEDLAEVISVLVGISGPDQVSADLIKAGLPVDDGCLDLALLDRAASRLEYKANWHDDIEYHFPCCLLLNSGGYVVAIGRENQSILLQDRSNRNVCHPVPQETIANFLQPKWFSIHPNARMLINRHSRSEAKGHWFWDRLTHRKDKLFDIVLGSLTANLLAVVTSLFALQVYDRVIPAQSEATLWVLALGVFIAILFEMTLRIARSHQIDKMGKDTELHISSELFSSVLGMKLDARPSSPGGIVSMVREFGAVREFFTAAAVGVVADLPFTVLFLVLIYGIAGNVAWVILVGCILTVLPSLLLQKRMQRLSEETMGGMSSANRLLTEVSYGLESVKASRFESFFQRQWEEIIALNSLKTTEQRGLSSFLMFWAIAVQQSTYVLAVVSGVYLIFNGELTMGAIIAVGILTTRTLAPITQMSQILSRWQNMNTSLCALDKIIKSPQDRETDRAKIKKRTLRGKFELKNVSFKHQNTDRNILEIENLKIAEGTRVALLGSSGSGKSTLLRVLSGLYYVSSGELLVDDIDIRQIEVSDIRRCIGYLPQDIRLFCGTLRENLSLSGHHSDEQLLDALDFAGLGDFVRKNSRGLDLQISDGGYGLSVGQRQSVGLSRLFLQDPSVVLLDEPTSALDQKLAVEVTRRIDEWIGSRTCVFSTHRMELLAAATDIVVLNNGQVQAIGPKDDFISRIRNKKPKNSEIRSEL